MRRVLKYAGICAAAVAALAFLFQLVLHGLSAQRLLRYAQVTHEWNEHWQSLEGVESFFSGFTLAVAATAYVSLMCLMLGKWKRGAGLAGTLLALVVLGLIVPVALPYAGLGVFAVLYVGQISVAVIPLERVRNAEVYRRRFWRHFRLRNFVWLCTSVGFLLYYLLIMGYFVSLDALLHLAFVVAGRARLLDTFASPFYGEVPWDDLLYSSLLAAGMAFYHFFCSAFGINQLDYIVDAGQEPIRHREFWWPFKRAAEE